MNSPNWVRVAGLSVIALAYSASPLLAATFFTLNYPGAIATEPRGINDVGQVVGTYADGDGRIHGFVWILGSFTTIDVDGPTPRPKRAASIVAAILSGNTVGQTASITGTA